ncbi:MAG: DUF3352 domain-containing protein [Symploca sp. SIO1C4]|uniref:DUF3352 domain-containing protein n=1 Tax=Symploca sp. SIO1C4 TaxID=2607765 RepID=A0A6B3NAC1_9CYAN|nr:DUF3352 domain-containing protein [Symploca sp. SIO1C4]
MKLRSFFSVLAVAAIGLLLTAVGGFFWLTSQSPLNLLHGGVNTNPTAAMFVPKQAPIMFSMQVNPERLEAFRQLAAPPVYRRQARAELQQFEQSLLAIIDTDLDYRRDIQPWLGDEITLAVTSLDFDRNRENKAQPGYLLALTAKDPKRAREFLQLFYSKQALSETSDLVLEKYKGVNLLYQRPLAQIAVSGGDVNQSQISTTLTSAIVGDRFVLFANHPKVLRSAINTVQAANLSLENDPVYQQTLQSLSEPRIGLSFVNLPALTAWIANQPVPVQDTLQGSKTLLFDFSLDRQGLIAQTALVGAEPDEQSQQPTLSQPVAALQYIPAKSALAIAGTDLNQLWNHLQAGVASDETLKPLLEKSLASLQSRWGIQLPEDVFSWVKAEYALSMLPRPDKDNPDWIFVAQKSDSSTAQVSIEHLDTVAKQQGMSVGFLSLGEQRLTAWTKLTTSTEFAASRQVKGQLTQTLLKLEAQVQGVHATMGDYEIFTSSIAAMDEALKGRGNSLLKSEQFQSAIASLPEDNDGYFYLDWKRSEALIKRQLPIVRVAQLVGKPLFEHLQSLSLSSYGIDQGVRRSKLFLRLDTTE